jgi:large subunit ribosomal protein L31
LLAALPPPTLPGSSNATIPTTQSGCRQDRVMKEGIHPEYHPVIFMDTSTGHKWMTCSTMKSKETVKWEDGESYPLIKVDISRYSHPYFTGKMKLIDSAGRIEKFQKKYNWGKAKQAEEAAPAAEEKK